MDQLGLVQPIDHLGQGVVVAVTLAADRRRNAGLGQPLAVADRDVLRASVAVMDQGILWIGLPVKTCLTCSWLHSLKGWSLRKTRGGSILLGN